MIIIIGLMRTLLLLLPPEGSKEANKQAKKKQKQKKHLNFRPTFPLRFPFLPHFLIRSSNKLVSFLLSPLPRIVIGLDPLAEYFRG